MASGATFWSECSEAAICYTWTRSLETNGMTETREAPTGTFESDDLLARIQAQDREALSRVVRENLRPVLRAARGTGLSPADAEEVVQEVFKTFIETAPRFEGRSRIRTWLFGILYRKLSENRRKAARNEHEDLEAVFESRFSADGHWTQPPRRPDQDLEAHELRQQLRRCLGHAPAAQRMAFVLREAEGLSTAEICKILGVSRTNLGVMLHRVRNRLRECLESKGAESS